MWHSLRLERRHGVLLGVDAAGEELTPVRLLLGGSSLVVQREMLVCVAGPASAPLQPTEGSYKVRSCAPSDH